MLASTSRPIPPYETGPAAGIRPTAKFGVATRVPGHGAVVMEAYRTRDEARRARQRIMRRKQFVSPLLERIGARAWVPADPKLRAGYATESVAV